MFRHRRRGTVPASRLEDLVRDLPDLKMRISRERYEAIEKAYVESSNAVRWAYAHWDLDTGIEGALREAMGDGVADSLVSLLKTVEDFLESENGVPRPLLILRPEDLEPKELEPES